MRRFASSCPYTPVWYISRMLSGVNTLVYVEVMSDRLTKSDWIDHGLRTLANDGPNGLKVGPMSATLKVSRGSFYWHFRDIADFRSQILRSWQERMTNQVIQEVAGKAEPDRLRHLLKPAWTGPQGLGPQRMKMWPRSLPPSMPAGSPTSQNCWSRQEWKAAGRYLRQPSCTGLIWVGTLRNPVFDSLGLPRIYIAR